MTQNITSATYKGVHGWMGVRVGRRGWVVGSGYPLDTIGPVVFQRSHNMAFYKVKQAVW